MSLNRLAQSPSMPSKFRTPAQQWRRDRIDIGKHQANARREFRRLLGLIQPLADGVVRAHPGRGKSVLRARRRDLNRVIDARSDVTSFLEQYMGLDSHHEKTRIWRGNGRKLLREVALSQMGIRQALEKLDTVSAHGFRAIELAADQEPLRRVLPEELLAFLPDNIVVNVDSQGRIQRITDRFNNEKFTLEKKIQRMKLILNLYNTIVRKVRRDMRSSNERTKLAALVTAILMETGIRPGRPGSSATVTVGDERIEIETFGAITLGPSHVQFVRDNFAKIEFVGKAGTVNTASVSDQLLIRTLRDYVQKAQRGQAKYIFVGKDGKAFTYAHLSAYFKANFQGINPTDFRKLRATEATLDALRDSQEDLYERIRGFAQMETEELRTRVVEALVETLDSAITQAQAALSHESASTTRGAYINPAVILDFFSQGQAAGTLRDAVLDSQAQLAFDPMTFVRMAAPRSVTEMWLRRSGSGGVTLRMLLEDLGDELGEDSPDQAIRLAKVDVCAPFVTSAAWVAPNGKVFDLQGKSHGAWAQVYLKRPRDPETQEDAYAELVDQGWIRVGNIHAIEARSLTNVRPAAWRAVSQLVLDCILKDKDLQYAFLWLDHPKGPTKVTLTDFVRRFGGADHEDQLFSGLLERRLG